MVFCAYPSGSRVEECVRVETARSFRVVIAVLIAAVLLAVRTSSQQCTYLSHHPKNTLEGHWQSCREPDGRYSERVYDHVVNGVGKFEVHMGPRREFGIFKGVQDEHRDHNSAENLLKP